MVGVLTKILSLMQKSYDEDKLAMEESKNFSEEKQMEKDKKFKEMLALLKERKGGEGETPTTEKEEESSLLDKFGGLGSVLLNVAKFFMGNAWLLPLVGAAAILAAMSMASEESHEQASKVQGAGDVSTEGAAITNIEGADRKIGRAHV